MQELRWITATIADRLIWKQPKGFAYHHHNPCTPPECGVAYSNPHHNEGCDAPPLFSTIPLLENVFTDYGCDDCGDCCRYRPIGEDETDRSIGKACDELEIARDLFLSVVSGEPASTIARRHIPQGTDDNKVLILDIAHSHTHRAVDFLKYSKNSELYHEPLQLLSKARRESAPTTLYRLAYQMAMSRFHYRSSANR